MHADRSAGGLAWLIDSRHAALPRGCPVISKRLLRFSHCNCAGTPRTAHAGRPRKPDEGTRRRLLGFKTAAGPPLEVTVRDAASSAELRAAAHLRAASFFTYPLDRSEFSARVDAALPALAFCLSTHSPRRRWKHTSNMVTSAKTVLGNVPLHASLPGMPDALHMLECRRSPL